MTARVIVTDLADADTAQILDEMDREAGYRAADRFNARVEDLYDRLGSHPDSCQARPKLGPNIRVGVVHPYLGVDTASIIRIIHGRRKITRRLLGNA
jgi:toxin ParE1/3/4